MCDHSDPWNDEIWSNQDILSCIEILAQFENSDHPGSVNDESWSNQEILSPLEIMTKI